MISVDCDKCGSPIPSTVVSFKLLSVSSAFAADDRPVDADFCTARCLTTWVDEHFPVKRPDFAAAHAILDDADSLDEAIDAGAMDEAPPLEEFEGEPITPPTSVLDRLPRGRLSHASRVGDVVRDIEERCAQ